MHLPHIYHRHNVGRDVKESVQADGIPYFPRERRCHVNCHGVLICHDNRHDYCCDNYKCHDDCLCNFKWHGDGSDKCTWYFARSSQTPLARTECALGITYARCVNGRNVGQSGREKVQADAILHLPEKRHCHDILSCHHTPICHDDRLGD